MEQDHRNKILNNLDRLVQYTKYDVLVEACLEHQLLFRVMVDRIQVRIFSVIFSVEKKK